jgi:hypothetical protein
MAVQITRSKPVRPPRRRTTPPREPRVRKEGFKTFRDKAFARILAIKGHTVLGQYYAMLALLVFIGLSAIGAIWLVREIDHRGAVALAAYDWCSDPETLKDISHPSACASFSCLAELNEKNGKWVRICRPEALRS